MESTQKQISMKPKAGRGRLPFEPVLKIVALTGFVGLSMVLGLNSLPVIAGSGRTAEISDTAGRDGRAGLVGLPFSMIFLGKDADFFGLLFVFVRATIFVPSEIVYFIVLVRYVLTNFGLVLFRNS